MKKSLRLITASVLVAVLCLAGGIQEKTMAASGKTSSYVVTRVKTVVKTDGRISNKYNIKYSYNKNGLINSQTKTYKNKYGMMWRYRSDIDGEAVSSMKCQFKYDKKNRHLKTVQQAKGQDVTDGNAYAFVYEYDNKGRVTGGKFPGSDFFSQKYKYNSKGYCTEATGKIKYNSKGLPTRINSLYGVSTTTFKYDKKGNWKFAVYKDPNGKKTKYSVKNTYSGGRLSKQIIKNGNTTTTRVFSYKKISVPKKLTSRIKAQKKYILLNGYLISEEAGAQQSLVCFY